MGFFDRVFNLFCKGCVAVAAAEDEVHVMTAEEEADAVYEDLVAAVREAVCTWNTLAAAGKRIRPVAGVDMSVICMDASRRISVQAGRDAFGSGTWPVVSLDVYPGGRIEYFEGAYGRPTCTCDDSDSAAIFAERAILAYMRMEKDAAQ